MANREIESTRLRTRMVGGLRGADDDSAATFVFGVAGGTEARAASAEVAQVHWTPLALLRDPTVADQVEFDLPGGRRTFPCMRVHGEIVWGLTYRILTDFLTRLEARVEP